MTFSIEPPFSLPKTEAEITLAAAAVGMPLPDACLAGVIANLALLAHHADILRHEPDGRGS